MSLAGRFPPFATKEEQDDFLRSVERYVRTPGAMAYLSSLNCLDNGERIALAIIRYNVDPSKSPDLRQSSTTHLGSPGSGKRAGVPRFVQESEHREATSEHGTSHSQTPAQVLAESLIDVLLLALGQAFAESFEEPR